ncbi:hypothetical protein B0T16DRAFT_458736 [Cercophora newfieldiana]|uniref:Uncharacterized protein n=1 Tax=Cercophora newfieldiana TaxID=92897 RepID=A0AA39Y6Y2_9PEZI|nr:hypothetical protein B0T16DRAFT_458736 [Cercophora newfieldiana]
MNKDETQPMMMAKVKFSLLALAVCSVSAAPSIAFPTASLLPRTSFACPVFPDFDGVLQICTDKDLFWDNRRAYGKDVTIYTIPNDPVIAGASSPSLATALETVESAVNRGLSYFQSWGAGLKIYIALLGNIPDDDGSSPYGKANAAYTTTSGGSPSILHCDVLILYPKSNDPDHKLRALKAVVHELYHCLQYAQNLNGAKLRGTSTRRAWWIEGTARFFDGVIYPPPTSRDLQDLGKFPEAYNPEISLVRQTYEAALFYHYLVQAGLSPSRVNNWVASKTGRSSVAEDVQDISETATFTSNWHGFARAFADNAINYTASIPIVLANPFPRPAALAPLSSLGVGTTQRIPYALEPFTFNMTTFRFPINTVHRLSFLGIGEGGFDCSYRESISRGRLLMQQLFGMFWQVCSGENFMNADFCEGIPLEKHFEKAEFCGAGRVLFSLQRL